jgi:assimilatory nitrate reductase catalytic subunit
MHWTAQVSSGGRINAAVNPAVDPLSGQPELKHTPVEIRRRAIAWHGTILAQRPVMMPDVTYWVHLAGAGHHVYLLAGEEPVDSSRRALSAAIRATNPGPWVAGDNGLSAVLSDGRLEAVLALGAIRNEEVRHRLAPFMTVERLSDAERRVVLGGGSAAEHGGEICACFGVSQAIVVKAIAAGATSLASVGARTQAGTSCGSCRPEIRALLRAPRPPKAA